MKCIRNFILVFILILLCNDLQAQINKRTYYSYGEKIFAEAYTTPSGSPDSVNVMIACKIVNSFLLFNKSDKNGITSYEAKPKLEIIFRDENAIIRHRFEVVAESKLANFDKTVSRNDYTYFLGQALLKNDNYEITLKLNNGNNSSETMHKISLSKSQENQGIHLFTPIYSQLNDISYLENIEPYILGDKIAFSSSGSRILIPANIPESSSENFIYSISSIKANPDDEDEDADSQYGWKSDVNISGKVLVRNRVVIESNIANDYKNLFLNIEEDRTNGYFVMDIELPVDKFVPATYELNIQNKSIGFSKKYQFSVEWIDAPISLKNIDYAIDMCYHILSDEEFDKMNEGTKSEKRANLISYWKKLDPTPLTPYNEAMNQYYTRVDYAFFNYKTVVEKDGAKSDRGKIYILNGPADVIDSKFIDNKSIEVWKYSNLKKEFEFSMVRPGVYKLIKING